MKENYKLNDDVVCPFSRGDLVIFTKEFFKSSDFLETQTFSYTTNGVTTTWSQEKCLLIFLEHNPTKGYMIFFYAGDTYYQFVWDGPANGKRNDWFGLPSERFYKYSFVKYSS
jgi:hypothetical protein